ncbi:unnamed protein product [Brachionus calyciflorus]|uniref:Ty3 transposon capsid-like protein domain-containing protein n=1 Tax=Brachionus calyciflorus TaxID=104777 RepID=A0A814CNQ1_9BILA|nr:unnamed protein product [Brachionus calyciflorus]
MLQNWERETFERSWESLKQKFGSLYNSRDSQNKLREKLLTIKTHKQNFEESVKKFESIVSKIVSLTEDEKIFLFSHTLNENVRQMVTVMKPNSLREAIELAQVYTTSLNNTEKINYVKPHNSIKKGSGDLKIIQIEISLVGKTDKNQKAKATKSQLRSDN